MKREKTVDLEEKQYEGNEDLICRGCGQSCPGFIFRKVGVTYAVNGQVIMSSERWMCPNCAGKVVREIFGTSMFPADAPEGGFAPIPHHDRHGYDCHDCGAKEGEYHTPGCDCERCPVCGGQLLSCEHSEEVQVPPLTLHGEDISEEE